METEEEKPTGPLSDAVLNRRQFLGAGAAGAVLLGLGAHGRPWAHDEAALSSSESSGSGGTLIVGGTFTDIPLLDTGLASGQGWEGLREVANELYDPLIRFNLSSATKIPTIIPCLATSWTPNSDASVWVFKLRQGVRFHDGTDWNADAAIFNLDRAFNKASKSYYPALAAAQYVLTGQIKSYSKLDDYTIQIATNGPTSTLANTLTTFYFASPTAVQKDGNAKFGENPVGSGPFKFESLTVGQELVLVGNKDYWKGAPKLDKYVLRPLPDPTARVAALRSGEVNWIEYPLPDDLASLRAAGYQVTLNTTDHIWPWFLDTTRPPLDDVRVRQALNFAIDRETMAKNLLDGSANPIYQYAPTANLAYRASNNYYSYDLDKAKKLLAEAGYAKGFDMTLLYPTSGSGNMDPPPMNEYLQGNLAEVGINVKLIPLEWASLLAGLGGPKLANNANAVNASQGFWQEISWTEYFSSKSGLSFLFKDPKVDVFLDKANAQLSDAARNDTYADLVAYLNVQAPWLVVVSDRDARAMVAGVKGYVQPQDWFVDFTTIWVE
jgi:peptide/nickel transport system substrate-binding protein